MRVDGLKGKEREDVSKRVAIFLLISFPDRCTAEVAGDTCISYVLGVRYE
jgi:hypothetical protein